MAWCAHVAPAQSADLPMLTEKFGNRSQQADFVIVIDRSGSVRRFWQAIKAAVAEFVSAVPDGDYVSILAFDAAAVDLLTPRRVDAASRGSFTEQIRALADPRGAFTDLGAGVEYTLRELNRPQANRLQFVFFFTDFKHDPPSGSRWKSRDCRTEDWAALRRQKERTFDARDGVVKIFALKLPLDAEVGRDFGLFQCVFGDVEGVDVGDSAILKDWFERKRAEIYREKIKIQIESEKNPGIDLALKDEGYRNRLSLVVASRCRTLDVEVESLSLAGGSAGGDLRFSPVRIDPFVLRPGENRTINVEVEDAAGGEFEIEQCRESAVAAQIEATAVLAPADEIRLLTEPRFSRKAGQESTVTCCRGIPLWWPATGAALLAIFLGGVYMRWVKPEYIGGTLVIERERKQEDKPTRREEIFRRRTLLVGNTDKCRKEGIHSTLFSGEEGQNVPVELEFRGRIPRMLRASPQRGVYVRITAGRGVIEQDQLDLKTNRIKKAKRLLSGEYSVGDDPLDASTVIYVGRCKVYFK
ncbi:MAG: VWA domain-containing protein [Blastocatellales bacterium]|nr:VWA domain-containing protein [Blastocatellales bacterium]